MNIRNFLTAIGMAMMLMTSLNLNAQNSSSSSMGGGGDGGGCGVVETIPGCGCQTSGFSPINGQSCASNVCISESPVIPDQLPIGDATDINASFWEQVSQIGMFGWASSSINSSTNLRSDVWIQYTPTNGVVDVEEVFGIIKTNQLTLSVLYPSDTVNFQVGLYNTAGNNLFYGYDKSPIAPPQNGVSSNVLNIVLEMSSESWVPFDGVRRFEIIERDANNNPIRYYSSKEWDIWNGRIRFLNYFAKKFGEIRVTLCNGTEVAHRLNGGKRIIPTTVVMAVGDVSAIGTRTFRDTNRAHIIVSLEESRLNINPVGQLLSIPITAETMRVSGLRMVSDGSDGSGVSIAQIPSGASIWRYGSPSSTAQWMAMVNKSWVDFPVELGQCYWVKLSFDGWPVGNQFYPPWDGNYNEATPVTLSEK